MSHFTVLVPAEDKGELEAVLLPYHEYECTGIEKYTEFVPADMDKLQADFEEYGDGRDLETFADDWAGYTKNDEGVFGCITNPNKKWDGWSVGGRWSGLLQLKDGVDGELGTPGVFGRGYDDLNGRADTALVKEIDWDAMLQEQQDNRAKAWDNWEAALAIAGKTPEWYLEDFEPRWKAACEVNDKDVKEAMREEWRLIRKAVGDNEEDKEERVLLWAMNFEPRGRTRQEHIESDRALTYAFLDLEGSWNQRGQMGWWGMSDESKGTLDYDKAFWQFVKSLPPGQRIYIVDCHI